MSRGHEADVPAEQPQAQAAPRLPRAHGDQERTPRSGEPPRQGPQTPVGLTQVAGLRCADADGGPSPGAPIIPLVKLRKRWEFLHVAGGLSERRASVVIQAKLRAQPRPEAGVGFTATRKIGGSVIRNRARRRLREAARARLPTLAAPGADYVFIARTAAVETPFARLLDEVESALLSLRRRVLAGEDAAPTRAPGPGQRPRRGRPRPPEAS